MTDLRDNIAVVLFAELGVNGGHISQKHAMEAADLLVPLVRDAIRAGAQVALEEAIQALDAMPRNFDTRIGLEDASDKVQQMRDQL